MQLGVELGADSRDALAQGVVAGQLGMAPDVVVEIGEQPLAPGLEELRALAQRLEHPRPVGAELGFLQPVALALQVGL
jgi:hypothetical protein